MAKAISIVLLYIEGCPSTPKTIERIRECTSELGVQIDLRDLLVRTQEEADTWRFPGSPTIQINGLDIDSSARTSSLFGFT